MTKAEFLDALRRRLGYLPDSEVNKSLDFYAESIDDRVEDGMSEAEAVAALGALEDIAREIEAALPLSTLVKRRVRDSRERSARRGHSALWIVLAVLGSPIWLPLLIVAFVLVLTVYVVIWAAIVSLFAALLSLVFSGVVLMVHGVVNAGSIGIWGALMALGAAAICIGLAIALEEPVRALAKALVELTGRFGRWVKRQFVGKGGGEA